MSLIKTLNKFYSGQWEAFSSPTDTIDDYDNIRWIGEPVSSEELSGKINEMVAAESYRTDRRLEYPPLQEQLDMMYWDSVNGTSNWKDLIQSVKEKYPKGN